MQSDEHHRQRWLVALTRRREPTSVSALMQSTSRDAQEQMEIRLASG
jgi:hypothetical protein